MAENDEPTSGPAEPTPVPAAPTVEQTAVAGDAPPAAPARERFTDRLWSFRAMVAVALAALLLGGGVGAAIAAVSHDDGPDRRGFMRWDGPGGPGFPGGPGMGPGDRREYREDLKEMRKDMRERMKERLEQQQDAPTPTPSPSATPNG